ncbi:MAG: hypothetical protein V6Z89_17510 [Desulfobacter sp.]
MKRYLTFVKENTRFALAIAANAIALIASIWWLVDSNLKTQNGVEIEPIVTCIALTATLLGLNFVNDKLTKPNLKVHMSMAITHHPIKGLVHGIGVTVENHSMVKAFIKNFQVEIPQKKQVVQFLYEGFTGQTLGKIVIEPGQAYSFNISKENLSGEKIPTDLEEFGDFVATTDIGYKFKVPAKIFREHYSTLMKC